MKKTRLGLTVNGETHDVLVPVHKTLLEVLREDLGLTGTRFGCGAGLCGACTVHVDGAAVRSCSTPLRDVAGRRVTTIEGLSRRADHPAQRAWLAEQVPQCGYCQSGQVMAAAALLARVPKPTDAEIDEAMSGVLCRCGTYNKIFEAALAAAKASKGGR
jgi:aerobic-type carbon monoxide dehydrogenase small subunit (CoxS/CutS family)